jgi:hypothetical protein
MRTDQHPLLAASIKRILVLAAIALSLGMASGAARAVLIDFDDIPYLIPGSDSDPADFAYHPLTDEYLAQGLLIDGGYLTEYASSDTDALSRPNYLLGGNILSFSFVGALPTYVSMYVSEANEFAVGISVYGTSGLLYEMLTAGWPANGSDVYPPYEPNQFVSFSAPSGISFITLSNVANLRAGTELDDLTYTYAAVSEPPSLALLAVGFVGLMWRRRRARRPILTGS